MIIAQDVIGIIRIYKLKGVWKMKNNKGVSAVIGVVLMVAITVAISGTVYVYISGMMEKNDWTVNMVVEGRVDYIYQRGLDNKTIVIINMQSFTLDNDLDFFDGIEVNDNIRLFLIGSFCDKWEYVES